MDTNGTAESAEDVSALFQQIGDLEKSFADVELDARKPVSSNQFTSQSPLHSH